MKLAFSTLGCPDWELEEIVAGAIQYGFDAVELRALGGSIDLLSRPEMSSSRISETRTTFEAAGIEICCIDSSAALHAIDENERMAAVESALRHAALAAALGAPLVRVFPNEVPPGSGRADTKARIASALREIASRLPDGVRIALETHGDFATGAAAAEIVRRAGDPRIAIVWDAANSFAAGEPVEQSARAVAPALGLVHLRDAEPQGEGRPWRSALAGRGRMPLDLVLAVLERIEFDGTVSFEWEKYWHRDIAGPEVALPDFVRAVGPLVGQRRKR